MANLTLGQSFTFRERDVLALDSTLRSAKMTLWYIARAWGWNVWFQFHGPKGRRTLEVMRAVPGSERGGEEKAAQATRLATVVEQVKALLPGQSLTIAGSDKDRQSVRAQLIAQGVAVSAHLEQGDLVIARWRDEYLDVARRVAKGLGAKKHQVVEAKLAGLAVDEALTLAGAGLQDGRIVRRAGRMLGTAFEIEFGETLRVTRRAKLTPARVSPVRPWLDRFHRLAVDESFAVAIPALERVGATYDLLSKRLHASAFMRGRRVSVVREGKRVKVRRVA